MTKKTSTKKPNPTRQGILKLRALLHRHEVADPGCPESKPYRRAGESTTPRLRPALDLVEKRLQELGLPLTRENYFAVDGLQSDPAEPLDAELEVLLPLEIQLDSTHRSDPPEQETFTPEEARRLWLEDLAENAMKHNPGLTMEEAIKYLEEVGA